MKLKERGFTLIEIIIVMSIIGMGTATVAPKAIEAQKKSESRMLKSEMDGVVSSFVSLETLQDSPVYTMKFDVDDARGNPLYRDYLIPIAPSATFQTVIYSGTIGKDYGTHDIWLDYGTNTVTARSDTGCTGKASYVGDKSSAPKAFYNKINVPGISYKGSRGISPIFNMGESKLLDDFIDSPNGLDWAQYRDHLSSKEEILSTVFGGATNTSEIVYHTHSGVVNSGRMVSAPVLLSLVDTSQLPPSKILSKYDKGALYQVTGGMSRAEFVEYVGPTGYKKSIGKDGNGVSSDIANKMYDTLEDNFVTGSPVFVPRDSKSIIYSTESDLKYGYYVQ